MEMNREQYWPLYLAFVTAVCGISVREASTIHFRRHVVVHLPPIDMILGEWGRIEPQGIRWMLGNIGHVLCLEERSEDSEEMFLKAVEISSRISGHEHPDTLFDMSRLASLYSQQGRLPEAERMLVQVVEAQSRVLGE
jgi:hypothetical protein